MTSWACRAIRPAAPRSSRRFSSQRGRWDLDQDLKGRACRDKVQVVKRYVLRFKGAGAKPATDVARIRALPKLKVLDDASSRMMLVEAPEAELPSLMHALPHWVMSEERMIPLPDPQQKVRSAS